MIRLKVVFGLVNHSAVMLKFSQYLLVLWVVYRCLKWKRFHLQVSVIVFLPFVSHFTNCVLTVTFCCSHPKSLFSSEIESRGFKCIWNLRLLVCRSSCWHIALTALFTHDRILSQVVEWMNWSVRCVQERLNLDHKWKVYQSVVL